MQARIIRIIKMKLFRKHTGEVEMFSSFAPSPSRDKRKSQQHVGEKLRHDGKGDTSTSTTAGAVAADG